MNYIKVGTFSKPLGLKGELKVATDSDFVTERFAKGNVLFGNFPSGMKKITISSFRLHQGKPVITVDDLFDINLIQDYLGIDLFVDQDTLKPLKEDEFYLHELLGKRVENTEGELLGTVTDVIFLPSSPVLEVKDGENERILIPFVNAFIAKIDKDLIIINEIEGLR